MSDSILEFAKSYHTVYKDKFYQNATKLFDSLVSDSAVNVLENRKHAKEYRTAQLAADKLQKRKRSLKVGKGFAIFGIVVACIAFVLCIYLLSAFGDQVNRLGCTITIVVSLLLLAGMILLIKLKINPTLAKVQDQLTEKQTHANNLNKICINELSPLYAKFKIQHTMELCQQTIPEIVLDKNFSMSRFAHLAERYGLQENFAENESTLGIFSGEILGNPFVEERRLIQSMGTHTYTGSMVITWTTIATDSKGNARTVTHTQTLYASVVKPKPYYHRKTTLIFGSDAAPDLSFSHEPTHCENWSESELARKIRRGSRKIDKIAEKSLKNGGKFTELANEEFDVLFNAFDRDHEVQFRLLFTPLAQQNMTFLMRNPVPYGDDFYFLKRKKLNYISSEHAQNWDFDPSVERYLSYDIDLCRKKFLNYNCDFFCNLFFELAPIMSIPLYQQFKSQEFIYGEKYHRNCTSFEAECMANNFSYRLTAPDNAQTECILKTSFSQMDGAMDSLVVTAHAFTTVEHVEFVPTWGRDGCMHNVPVYWLEYIPVQKQMQMTMCECDDDTNQKSPNALESLFKHGIFVNLLGFDD